MSDIPFKERRKYIRFGIDARVNFKPRRADDQHPPQKQVPGIIRNLSFEGACFIIDESFEPGTLLQLEIFLPSYPQPLHAEGEVRWSRAFMNQDVRNMFETGVKLTRIEPQDQRMFIDYVRNNLLQAISSYLHL